MRGECAHDWNAMASVWDQFENQGLSPDLLNKDLLNSVSLPLVVVGCGKGLVLKHVQDELGSDGVYGLDISEEMVSASEERGCANVYISSGDNIDIGVGKYKTIIVSTGVLDVLETWELEKYIVSVMKMLEEDGRVLIFAFGQFGPKWKVAKALKSTCSLGIENDQLFNLYEKAVNSSLELALSEFSIDKRNKLIAKTWVHSIKRFLNDVIDKTGDSEEGAMQFIRAVSPKVQRRFTQVELKDVLDAGVLKIDSIEEHFQAGVIRITAKHAMKLQNKK